jgi:hypothetical protein
MAKFDIIIQKSDEFSKRTSYFSNPTMVEIGIKSFIDVQGELDMNPLVNPGLNQS